MAIRRSASASRILLPSSFLVGAVRAGGGLSTAIDARVYWNGHCSCVLDAAMEEAGDDPAYIAAVLGDIAKARGILKLAEDTGMTRGGLYRALSPGGNPSFETILKVTKALGLKVTISKAA